MRAAHPRPAKPPGQLLRRIAERFSSAAPRERILLPLLADLQFEHGRTDGAVARFCVRLRWIVAFWQALGFETLRGSGPHLRANAWGATEAERESARRFLPRAAWVTATITLVLVAERSWRMAHGLAAAVRAGVQPLSAAETFRLALTVSPSALCVAIPSGLLLGIMLAAEGRPTARPQWRSVLGIATLAGLVTFAVAALILPTANQKHRLLEFGALAPKMDHAFAGPRALAVGDREMGLGELSDRARELRASGRPREAAPLDVEWQKKPALGASCVALALAGAAIAWRIRGDHRSTWLRAARALARWLMAGLVLSGWYVLLRMGEEAADKGAMAPAVAMWGPSLVVAAFALAALARRRQKAPAATAG